MADIFISYTSSDRDWAFWIGQELEKLGHTAHLHEWEISGGGDIAAWMVERHHDADHVLCVISKAYLKKPYSKWERLAAQWAAASERPNFLLPVFIEECEAPTLLSHIKRCDLYDVEENEARQRLKAFVTPAAKPSGPVRFPGSKSGAPPASPRTAVAFPGRSSAGTGVALSNIPIAVPLHFLGRDDDIAAIDAVFARGKTGAAITTLHGMRGVGKTTLAAAYAERHRGDYRATWWIRAQTESTMRADLVGLGVRFGWVAADEKEEPAITTLLERLRDEGEGILLIYDNAPDAAALRDYLPRSGVRVLVTSNSPVWRGVAEPVEIKLWPKNIGAEYLVERTGRMSERAAAEALSEALGGLPLAHEQAAAYCERLGIPLAEYQKRFQVAPARFLDNVRDAPREYNDGRTVAKSFALAIEEAAKVHPAAEPLIVHAALLAPEPIPLFLFSEAREELGEPLATALGGDDLDEVVAALRAFALIDRESIPDERDPTIKTDCIRLHRLVRQVAAARSAEEGREAVRQNLIAAVAAVYPPELSGDVQTLERARRLDAIALALIDGSPSSGRIRRLPEAYLMNQLARYRYLALAAYAEARTLLEKSLTICEKELGPEDLGTASTVIQLARVLRVQGRLAAAQSLFRRGLAICEKMHGLESSETAIILNELAATAQVEGDLAGARSLYERALAILEKTLGPAAPETATALNDLASLLLAQGDNAEARSMCERALLIYEEKLGSLHPHTNTARCNLADVMLATGNAKEALPLAQAALAANNKVFGKDHPSTESSARVVVDALDSLDRTAEAAELRMRYRIAAEGTEKK